MIEAQQQVPVAHPGGDLAPVGAETAVLTHFVNGASCAGTGTGTQPVFNPATGQPIAQALRGTPADVDKAVAAAKEALPGWRQRTPKDRADVLLRAAAVLEANAEELAHLESVNTGKPMPLARDDVAGTIDTLQFMAGAVRTQLSLSAGEYVTGRTSMIVREPVGVVAAITPWNYPLLTAAWKSAPILAVGNTCVLKPSDQTPLTALRMAELLAEVFPAGVLNIVTGAGSVFGEALATHPDVALVSVTGSVRSGQAVASAAATTLKRVHLELGGKPPVIVFADADLDAVAEGIRLAGFGNSGQDCGAACRILVEQSVHDELLKRLVPRVECFRRCWWTSRTVPGPLVRRSSGPWSRWRPSPMRMPRSRRPIAPPTGCPRRSGPRTPVAPTICPGGWTSAPCGSTTTSHSPPKCRGAGSSPPATGATCRRMRSMTTRVASMSCSTGLDALTRRSRHE